MQISCGQGLWFSSARVWTHTTIKMFQMPLKHSKRAAGHKYEPFKTFQKVAETPQNSTSYWKALFWIISVLVACTEKEYGSWAGVGLNPHPPYQTPGLPLTPELSPPSPNPSYLTPLRGKRIQGTPLKVQGIWKPSLPESLLATAMEILPAWMVNMYTPTLLQALATQAKNYNPKYFVPTS